MSPFQKGIVLAIIQLAIVSSLGAKLFYDRATRPRVWVRTAAYDPDLPIRGRYVSLLLELKPIGITEPVRPNQFESLKPVQLRMENRELIAVPDEENGNRLRRGGKYLRWIRPRLQENKAIAVLSQPVAFFISEHAQDPVRRPLGEELWAEVTLPKKGPPRPIRLAVKKENGTFTLLDLN